MQSLEMENFEELPQSTPILDFYRGKVVFLTGGTGFIGKLLLEKLLRINVRQIVLLLREKKGRSIDERLGEILSGPIFAKLIEKKPELKASVKIIDGDFQKPDLGMTKEALEYLHKETQIILHAAADVRFDQTIKKAVEVNVRGTRDLMRMAMKMKKLEAIVYISTAYSNCPLIKIEEKFYPPAADPEKMIALAELMDEKLENEMKDITAKVIAPWPNTYVYSKSITEEVVRLYGEILPIAIVRPSIIVSTKEEPMPGWCDNIYGLNGMVVGVALGIIRIVYINNHENRADIIPADFVMNIVLASAWQTYRERVLAVKQEVKSQINNGNELPNGFDANDAVAQLAGKTKIYNCVCTPDNPISYSRIYQLSIEAGMPIPPIKSLWIVCLNIVTVRWIYRIMRFFYHSVPAHMIDLYLRLIKRTPRLISLYEKVHKFTVVTDYFANRSWTFENNNTKNLIRELSAEDRKLFDFDVRNFKWEDFFLIYMTGLRRHLANEPDNNVMEARVRYKRMVKIHYAILGTVYAFIGISIYFLMSFFGFGLN